MKNEKLLKIKELLASVLLDEEAKETETQKFGSISTDIAVIYWDGEEDLKEGDLVYVADENGENKTQAEDGEYKLEDGTIYKVENGRVAEIIVPEVEPENNPEPEAEPEAPETEVNAEDEPAPEEPAKEEEKPETDPEPEKVEEEVRDLAKEIDELKELVAELSKKLEAVEKEAPKTPAEEFEAMKDEDEKVPMAVKYAQALRK